MFARHVYMTEGLKVFFNGMEVSAFQSALEKALYFLSYTALKKGHHQFYKGAPLDSFTNLFIGYIADWSHLPMTLPVDAWTTEIKTNANGRAPLKVLLAMLSDKDRNFYKGLSAYWLLCLRPALQYTIYEQVKAAYLKSKARTSLSSMEAFLLGMISRGIATTVVFPFQRAKVLLQTKDEDCTATTMSVLQHQLEKVGISGIFQGLGPELTRGVLSAAVMLMIKERIGGSMQTLLSTRKD